jgi:hypothetical protein
MLTIKTKSALIITFIVCCIIGTHQCFDNMSDGQAPMIEELTGVNG